MENLIKEVLTYYVTSLQGTAPTRPRSPKQSRKASEKVRQSILRGRKGLAFIIDCRRKDLID